MDKIFKFSNLVENGFTLPNREELEKGKEKREMEGETKGAGEGGGREEWVEKLRKLDNSRSWREWVERNWDALRCRPRTQKGAYREIMEEWREGEMELESPSHWQGDPISPFYQKEVYFGKLSPSSKTRPFLILQNNNLNRLCWAGLYSTILVAPLSGRLGGGDYRILIPQRDNLTRPSEVVLSAIGVISPAKLFWSRGQATTLTSDEWRKVVEGVKRVLGVELW
jgi:mRNA-degrading endonuclease toxin of MazEF toxin-antitoxin module